MICVRCGKALKAFTAAVKTQDGKRGWGPKCAKLAGMIQPKRRHKIHTHEPIEHDPRQMWLEL